MIQSQRGRDTLITMISASGTYVQYLLSSFMAARQSELSISHVQWKHLLEI